MSRKYKIRDQNKRYFVTFAVIRWIDVFTRDDYRQIFFESIRFGQAIRDLNFTPIISCRAYSSDHRVFRKYSVRRNCP